MKPNSLWIVQVKQRGMPPEIALFTVLKFPRKSYISYFGETNQHEPEIYEITPIKEIYNENTDYQSLLAGSQ